MQGICPPVAMAMAAWVQKIAGMMCSDASASGGFLRKERGREKQEADRQSACGYSY